MGNVFADFIVSSGLYYPSIEVTKDNVEDLISLLAGKVKLDLFCRECGEMRIFSMEESVKMYYYNDTEQIWIQKVLADEINSYVKVVEMTGMAKPGDIFDHTEEKWAWSTWQIDPFTHVIVLPYTCALDSNHKIDFILRRVGNNLIKIGQYPSIADLEKSELRKFRKVFSAEDMTELRRAVGLYADGIGVGSYVYLRRIIERLVLVAKNKAISDGKKTEADFKNKRTEEIIKELKGYLPDTLVSSKEIYGIVSKGIHELSEEQCIAYFSILYNAILLILEEEEAMRQENLKKDEISKSISQLHSVLK